MDHALGEFTGGKRFKEAEETLLAGLKIDEKSWHGQFTRAALWELGH